MNRRNEHQHQCGRDLAPVRISIDGNFLNMPDTGIGTYVTCLSNALEAASAELELDVAILQPSGRLLRPGGRLQRLVWDAGGVARSAMAVRPRPELIHIPQMSAPLVTPFPVVVTIHDVIPLVFPDYRSTRAMQAYLALMSKTARRARHIITPSRASANDIMDVLGVAADNLTIIPEAASPELQPDETGTAGHRAARYLGIKGRYLFYLGGFDRRKNVPLLIRSFANALPSLPEDTSLVIGGRPQSANPRLFPELEPVIRECGIGDRVRLTDRLTNDERLLLYQGADGFVMPSLHEGFGLPVLEAMACGIPVIAADRTSLPEVLGDAGMLVPPVEHDLTQAIVELVANRDRHDVLARSGLERSKMFSWAKAAEETAAVYRRALGQIESV